MKVTQSVLALWLLSVRTAAAWTTSPSAFLPAHRVVAVQLHSAAVSTEVEGEEATESFRLKFLEDAKPISPWHDIALKNDDGSYNMVRTNKPTNMPLVQFVDPHGCVCVSVYMFSAVPMRISHSPTLSLTQ